MCSANHEQKMRRLCTWLYTVYGRPLFLIFIAINLIILMYHDQHKTRWMACIAFTATFLNGVLQFFVIQCHPAFKAMAIEEEEAINGSSEGAFLNLDICSTKDHLDFKLSNVHVVDEE